MKQLLVIAALCFSLSSIAQTKPTTLKSILLAQLKTTHNVQDWFVPINQSLEGLTPEQAIWKDKKDNHSVAELATHLLFWDKQQLAKFKGVKGDAFDGDNTKTFSNLSKEEWATVLKQLDQVLTDLEKLIEQADDAQVAKWSGDISHISTHNAYHTGQILYIRKSQGSWNPEKGVK